MDSYEMTFDTHIIAAFPGLGKTYAAMHQQGSGLRLLDLDSSRYAKIKGERNPEYPSNYVNDLILERDKKVYNAILIPTKDNILKELIARDITFAIILPVNSRDEYISRITSDCVRNSLSIERRFGLIQRTLRSFEQPGVMLYEVNPKEYLSSKCVRLIGDDELSSHILGCIYDMSKLDGIMHMCGFDPKSISAHKKFNELNSKLHSTNS